MAKFILDNIPREITYKIYSYLTPEIWEIMKVSNYDLWNVYRLQTQKNILPWDSSVDWMQQLLPSDYLYVRHDVIIGDMNDIMTDQSRIHSPGLYKLEKFGRWVSQEGEFLQIPDSNNHFIFGLRNICKHIVQNDLPVMTVKSVKKIAKITSDFMLAKRDMGNTGYNGMCLNDEHYLLVLYREDYYGDILNDDTFFPLIFLLTRIPENIKISLKSPIDTGDRVVWKVYDSDNISIGRLVSYRLDSLIMYNPES